MDYIEILNMYPFYCKVVMGKGTGSEIERFCDEFFVGIVFFLSYDWVRSLPFFLISGYLISHQISCFCGN